MSSPSGPDAARAVPYDHEFYDEISPFSVDAARVVVPIVHGLVKPASVVDVGCGTGAWLAAWRDNGVTDILGIDGDYVDRAALHIDPSAFRSADLERPPAIERRFDLAMSVEVAEHLDRSAAARFVAFLSSLAPVVLFSAAPPGQGGVDHINEQWPAYWAHLFADHGLRPFDVIRPRVWQSTDVAFFYAQNLVLYAADGAFSGVSPALPLVPDGDDGSSVPMPLVHPALFDAVLGQANRQAPPASLSSLVRQIPRATDRAVRRRLAASRRRTGSADHDG